MLEHVIFDLDGTLTDPREGITRSYAYALEKLGLPAPPLTELERYIGPPTRDVVADLLGTRDPARIEETVRIYRERFSTVGLFENHPFPGIDALLSRLAARGCTLWVCTSKPTVYAEPIAQHYGFLRFLRKVYGCELDGTRGDKRELLAYLLEQEKIAPASAVMIGDRLHDIRAAQACGVRNIGVLYGFGSEAELREAGAEHLCETVDGLYALLERLS